MSEISITAHGSQLTYIPVVFYHDKTAPYLKAAIDCARKYNEHVVLLGVESNKDLSPEWYDTDKFTDTGYEDFERAFVNLSSNSAYLESIWFKRYFYFTSIIIRYI